MLLVPIKFAMKPSPSCVMEILNGCDGKVASIISQRSAGGGLKLAEVSGGVRAVHQPARLGVL